MLLPLLLSSLGNLLRDIPAPTRYRENFVTAFPDVELIGIFSAGIGFVICTVFFLLAQKSNRVRLGFANVFAVVLIGVVIISSLFGTGWQSATLQTRMLYKQGATREFHGRIGLHVGIHSFNVTLIGTPERQFGEHIAYNEQFHFGRRQGRVGFGPYSSQISRDFRNAQRRGVPLPILRVAEYVSLDGERIRWGRYMRVAGLYAEFCMWFSFWFYCIALVTMLGRVWRLASRMLVLSGIVQMCAIFCYTGLSHKPDIPLEIPFHDGVMRLKYAWTFWSVFASALLSMVWGLSLIKLSEGSLPIAITATPWTKLVLGTTGNADADSDSEDEEEEEVADSNSQASALGAIKGKSGASSKPLDLVMEDNDGVDVAEENDDDDESSSRPALLRTTTAADTVYFRTPTLHQSGSEVQLATIGDVVQGRDSDEDATDTDEDEHGSSVRAL